MRTLFLIFIIFVQINTAFSQISKENTLQMLQKADDFYAITQYDSALSFYSIASINFEKLKDNANYFVAKKGEVNSYAKLENYELAFDFSNLAIGKAELLMGKKNLVTSDFYLLCGIFQNAQKNAKTSLPYFAKALEIRQSIYFDNHPAIAEVYLHMGEAFDIDKEFEKALDNKNKALKMFKNTIGMQDTTANIYISIGNTYSLNNKTDKAIENYSTAEKFFSKKRGFNNSWSAKCFELMGNAYIQSKEYDKAQAEFTKELNIFLEIYGQNRVETGSAYEKNANCFFLRNELKSAIRYQTNAINSYRKAKGDKSLYFGNAYKALGNYYFANKQFETAAQCYEETAKVFSIAYGEDNQQVSDVYKTIADCYNKAGKKDKAKEFGDKSITK